MQYTTGNEIADCNALDIACICSNDEFLNGIACCLEDACDEEGKDAAVAYARQICSTQDIEVPGEVVCRNPSGSGSDTSSAAETSAAETETTSEPAATTDMTTDETTDETTTTTGTSTESDATETTASTTETADEGESTETDAPDAAHKALSPAGGVLGAAIALAFAL